MRCVTGALRPGGTNVITSPDRSELTGTRRAYTTEPSVDGARHRAAGDHVALQAQRRRQQDDEDDERADRDAAPR